ncbi:MAG: pentapeptide repeat-containing protein [Verrucomicrobiales bacterium]
MRHIIVISAIVFLNLNAHGAAAGAGAAALQVIGGSASLVQELLKEKLKAEKFSDPDVSLNVATSSLDVVISGGGVLADTPGFSVKLDLPYWEASLFLAAQGDNLIDDDTIDITVNVFHRFEAGLPHPDDLEKGHTMSDGPASLVGHTVGEASKILTLPADPFDVSHPHSHTDRFERKELTANVIFEDGLFFSFNDEWSITSWKHHFFVSHLTNAPASITNTSAVGNAPAVRVDSSGSSVSLAPQVPFIPGQAGSSIGAISSVSLQESKSLTNDWQNVLTAPRSIGPDARFVVHDYLIPPGNNVRFYRALSDMNFANLDFSFQTLRNARFSRANLAGANLNGSDLRNGVFDQADLSSANLNGANLLGSRFARAQLVGAKLAGANLTSVDLTGADLRGADLTDANLHFARLTGTVVDDKTKFSGKWLEVLEIASEAIAGRMLSNRDLQFVYLGNCYWVEADLRNSNLSFSDLTGGNFSGANLAGANLSSVSLWRANLSGANLQGANLEGALLRGSDLSDGNLQNANLDFADLRDAHFTEGTDVSQKWRRIGRIVTAGAAGADLIGYDLARADLRRTDFAGANLKNADLSASDLSDADLRGANLEGANLDFARLNGVKIDDETVISAKWRLVAELATEGGVGRDLSGIDLSHADLTGVDFTKAELAGSNLRSAILGHALFHETNLENVELPNADLRSARLKGANLKGAEFSSVLWEGAVVVSSDATGALDFEPRENSPALYNVVMPDGSKRSDIEVAVTSNLEDTQLSPGETETFALSAEAFFGGHRLTHAPVEYQWLRNGDAIPGAVDREFTVGPFDAGASEFTLQGVINIQGASAESPEITVRID